MADHWSVLTGGKTTKLGFGGVVTEVEVEAPAESVHCKVWPFVVGIGEWLTGLNGLSLRMEECFLPVFCDRVRVVFSQCSDGTTSVHITRVCVAVSIKLSTQVVGRRDGCHNFSRVVRIDETDSNRKLLWILLSISETKVLCPSSSE